MNLITAQSHEECWTMNCVTSADFHFDCLLPQSRVSVVKTIRSEHTQRTRAYFRHCRPIGSSPVYTLTRLCSKYCFDAKRGCDTQTEIAQLQTTWPEAWRAQNWNEAVNFPQGRANIQNVNIKGTTCVWFEDITSAKALNVSLGTLYAQLWWKLKEELIYSGTFAQ